MRMLDRLARRPALLLSRCRYHADPAPPSIAARISTLPAPPGSSFVLVLPASTFPASGNAILAKLSRNSDPRKNSYRKTMHKHLTGSLLCIAAFVFPSLPASAQTHGAQVSGAIEHDVSLPLGNMPP